MNAKYREEEWNRQHGTELAVLYDWINLILKELANTMGISMITQAESDSLKIEHKNMNKRIKALLELWKPVNEKTTRAAKFCSQTKKNRLEASDKDCNFEMGQDIT